MALVIDNFVGVSAVWTIGPRQTIDTAVEVGPDLILINIVKPVDTQGWITLNEVRRNAHTKSLPVIVLMQEGTLEDGERAERAGATAFVSSWLPHELERLIKKLAFEGHEGH